jgi:hypothetical protein
MRAAMLLPSGGLRYHARALRFRRRWRPFRDGLADFVTNDWQPPRDRPLLLLGPSAGWCLPLVALADRAPSMVIAVDLDPLGLLLLRRRFRALRPSAAPPLHLHVGDALGMPAADAPTTDVLPALAALLSSHPTANVLFCNLWGQWVFDIPDDHVRTRWKARLPALLHGRTWASFYDRMSGPLAPRIDPVDVRSPSQLSLPALVERFYGHADGDGPTIPLVDHETGGLLPDLPRRHLAWELGPGAHHLVEAVAIVA